jgi:prepilin-type N-terminal cleavage/methylation domain-containing protein
MNTKGFTLLEMMFVVAIFTIVIGTLAVLSLSFANAAEMQELKITSTDEARRALMTLTPVLRQAVRQTVIATNLPGDSITFQIVRDLDGNGFGVDTIGAIELDAPITIQRDVNDVNNDGFTMSQLIMIDGPRVRVLANDLQEGVPSATATPPATAGPPVAPPGVGFWVAPFNGGYMVTVRTEGQTRRGRTFTTTVSEFILPRNTI